MRQHDTTQEKKEEGGHDTNESRQVLPSVSGQIRINRPISSEKLRDRRRRIRQHHTPTHERHGSSPVEWCNRFVSCGVGYAL